MTRIPEDPFDHGGIATFAEDLRAGRASSEAVTVACLERIEALDRKLGAFQHVAAEQAVQAAQAVDNLLKAGTDLGPLMGVPVAVKDIFAVEGMPTTNGSLMDTAALTGPEGSYVHRLKQAGAVILGKTRTVEFALGATGVNEARGTPWNPWDLAVKRFPGGSSSGSAVATAAGLCAFALGSDTGGSIRIPAALCGLFGLKTTVGLSPTDGVFPLSPTLDSVGPLCRSATDAAIVYGVTTGRDIPQPVPLRGLRLGRPADFFFDELDEEVANCVAAALEALADAGVEIVELGPDALPDPRERERLFPAIVPPELLSTLGVEAFEKGRARMDTVSAMRAAAGLKITAVEHASALKRHRDLKRIVADALHGLDGIVTPTTPMLAMAVDELKDPAAVARSMLASRNTQPGNIWGLCGVSLPVHQFGSALPVGLQIMCPPRRDGHMLSIAMAVEETLGTPARPSL